MKPSTVTILVEPAEPSSVRDNASPDEQYLRLIAEHNAMFEMIRNLLDVYHDDPESGQSTAWKVAEAAQDLIDKIRGKS